MAGDPRYLLEGLVVDEAGGVLWDLQLALLYVFPELPRETRRVSGLVFGG